jgi:RNA-directed DNA polymerase
VEAKRLPRAVARILTAIFEPDARRCRDGDRPHVGAREAGDKRTGKRQFGEDPHVGEVDREHDVGTLDHAWLMQRLEQRGDDRPFLRRIRQGRKAGGLETDGEVIHPTTGTPQGGVVSPGLATSSRHYGLDWWFQRSGAKRGRGEACRIRYADDRAPRRRGAEARM